MTYASLKKWLLFFLKAAVTGGLLWLVMEKVDLAETKRHMTAVSVGAVVLAVLLFTAQTFLAGIRWRIIMPLFDRPIGLVKTIRIFFEGMFFNQALPSTIGGDGIRIYRVYRQGLPFGPSFNGVLLDRVAGFISLILLVAVSQPLLHARIDNQQALFAFGAITGFGVFSMVALLALASLPETFARWRPIRGMMKLSEGARGMFKSPAIAISVLALSLAGHGMMVLAIAIIAWDLGLAVSFLDCLMIVPAVMLVATVPISIAGWGVREGLMVTAFGLLGAPESVVAAVSLIVGLCFIVVGLPGGILWFLNPDHNVADAAKVAEMTEGGNA